MPNFIKKHVNDTMVAYIIKSMCEIISLICTQERKMLGAINSLPDEKKRLVQEKVNSAQDKVIEMITEIELTYVHDSD